MRLVRKWQSLGFSVALLTTAALFADDRRAPRPQFSDADMRGVFFERLEDAFRGPRPTLSSVRGTPTLEQTAASGTPNSDKAAGTANAWTKLISPPSLEDEVKRVRLHFDTVVTTPGEFNGGGYRDARLDLSVLATMFAVINGHDGEVRWKDQAANARDIFARTAFNCKAGSTQVYNEAKLRKADLQDLLSGTALADRNAEPENDWSMIVDRSPMMEYAEATLDSLKGITNNPASMKSNLDQVRREAEIIAVVGEVLIQEGMDDYDDEDYAKLSRQMTVSASSVVESLDRGDFDAVRQGVGAITQSCDACHEQYR